MPNYDALIFPTLRKEPFGFVILEAMCAGVPVIASSQGGPQEILIPMKTGLLYEPGNAVELSEKLEYLHSQPDLYEQIRKNAYQEAKEKYDFHHYIKRIENILQETLYHG